MNKAQSLRNELQSLRSSFELLGRPATAADAITESRQSDTIAHYVGPLAALLAEAARQGYDTDHVRLDSGGLSDTDGLVDVWAWTADTADGDQDWRVYVHETEGE